MSEPHLVDRVRQVAADVEKLTAESEDRQAYRRAHGRDLSAAHKAALANLSVKLGDLRDRLVALVAPAPDVEGLRAEFEGLQARLERMEE